MKNSQSGLLLLLAGIACGAAGCSSTERFTLVAVRGIDREHFSTRPPVAQEPLRMENDAFVMLGWTTGVVPPFGEPIDKALIGFGGPTNGHAYSVRMETVESLASLAPASSVYRDVEITHAAWSIFVAGWSSIKVRATPVPPESEPIAWIGGEIP